LEQALTPNAATASPARKTVRIVTAGQTAAGA
jgi:hypothetical protein